MVTVRRLVRALTERAEREQHLLAEQARAEEPHRAANYSAALRGRYADAMTTNVAPSRPAAVAPLRRLPAGREPGHRDF
jgi:hypothetical protein